MLDDPSPRSRLTVIPVPTIGLQPAAAPSLPPGDPAGSSWSRDTLRLAAGGDEEAWRALVDAHADMLWTAIKELGLNGADAAAVWQHAWLSLAQHSDEALGHGDIGRWLLVTVVGEASRVRLRAWVPTLPTPRRPTRMISLVSPAGCDVGA